MNCDFVFKVKDGSRVAVCVKCGRAVAVASGNVVALCKKGAAHSQNKIPGLGDIVAAGLSAVGITKERVSRLVGGDCGCAKRQEALNKLGHKLGIGSPTPSGPAAP